MDERHEISKAFDEYVQDLVESGGLTSCDYESFEPGWQASRAQSPNLSRIAQKKLDQMGATVRGVLVKNEAGAWAAVSDAGRVMWLDSFEGKAARQAPASGEVDPVMEYHNSPSGMHVVWETLPYGEHFLYTHPPAKVPEGWNIKMIGDEIRIDAPNNVHFQFARDSRMPNHALPNMLYDLGSALLTTPTPAAAPEAEWVIQLRGEYLTTRGVWERPDHCGYTNDLHEAGRYSQEEAEKAEAMAPHKYKAVCLTATPPQEQ